MKLAIGGVSFSYGSINALEDIGMEVEDGELVSLVGPNGSGKSTFLKCINKILKPRTGTILLGESDVKTLGLKELAGVLGYVPQSATHAFPSTVFDAVLLGRRPHVTWGVSVRDKEIVARILVMVGLEGLAMRQFSELSGGERQKVLIARALAQEPQLLLLDEPTSNLDLRHQLQVLGLISKAAKESGISVVMAMHDLNLAFRFSDRMVFLKEGRVYAVGEPRDVLSSDVIRAVYGVEAVVSEGSGRPHIIPLAPVPETSRQIGEEVLL